MQSHIACVMPVCIIIELKVVQIDQGNSGSPLKRFHLILIIAAVIGVRNDILIKFIIIMNKQIHKLFMVHLTKRPFMVQTADKLHHIFFSANLNITGNQLVKAAVKDLQLSAFRSADGCICNYAVLTLLFHLREITAPACIRIFSAGLPDMV